MSHKDITKVQLRLYYADRQYKDFLTDRQSFTIGTYMCIDYQPFSYLAINYDS